MNAKAGAESLWNIYLREVKNATPHFNGRLIAIWGTRKTGIIVKEILDSLGYQCGFFVNSHPKAETCCDIPVYAPDKLDISKHYVIVTTGASEVLRYLINAGFGYEPLKNFARIHINGWHEDIEYDGCYIGRGTYGFQWLRYDDLLGRYISKIGRYCSINQTAMVHGNHPMDWVTTHPILYACGYAPLDEKSWDVITPLESSKRSVVGNDVWIGANAVIISGVKIGDGAIIGAGSIVTYDVPPYAVVGGVPARAIKYRFSSEMIESFLRIKWWDWPVERIGENIGLFKQPEIFCKTFDMP